MTMFATAGALATLRFDARTGGTPCGPTLTNVGDVASTAVTLMATAVAVAGMLATPVTLIVSVWPGPTLACVNTGDPVQVPRPVRVSKIRHGPSAAYCEWTGCTETVAESVANWKSVTVRLAENVPAVTYVCVMVGPLPVVPSPKSHTYEIR